MKEFEKWIDKYITNVYPAKLSEVHQGQIAFDSWKAALEWINIQVCPEAWDVGDVEFDIKQELKDA